MSREDCREKRWCGMAGAEVVVDHGGPLTDVLPLSHCRELDVQVLRPASPAGAERLVLAALRWRGVPTWRAGERQSAADPMSEHQLVPVRDSALHGSITW